jgi:Flp pilus assembly protein TadD
MLVGNSIPEILPPASGLMAVEQSPSAGAAGAPGRTLFPPWLVAALLALVTLALYWPATRYDFINYDDPDYVTANLRVQQGLTWKNVGWAFTTDCAGNWHPLTWLSLMSDTDLFGVKPEGFHFTNVALHAINGVLLFWLLWWLTAALWRSALVAALFAWHPVHVESVAWVAERKDVLSTCFGLVTLLIYTRYARQREVSDQKPEVRGQRLGIEGGFYRSPAYWLAWFCLALGLMSKPMLVTWPFVLLLLDYWPLGRWKPGAGWPLVFEKMPFLLLAAGASVITFLVQRTGGAVVAVQKLPPGMRMGNAVISYCRYLGEIFWPHDLVVLYPYPGRWPVEIVLLALVFLGVLSVVFAGMRRRHPFLVVGWLWFLGTLVPVIGVVQVGEQAMADRYTYIPSVGVLITAVWGAGELTRRWQWQGLILSIPAGTALLLCLILTRHQLAYWENSETLFRHALTATKNGKFSSAIHNCLGVALFDKGAMDKAIIQFQEAVRLNPYDPKARNNLGSARSRLGDTDAAMRDFQQAIRLDPASADVHFNLGNMYVRKHEASEAAGEYQTAVRCDPDSAATRNNFGKLLADQGQFDAAITQYHEALRIKPDESMAHYNLGDVLDKRGETNAALSEFETAARLNPKDIIVRDTLGDLLARIGRRDEAIHQYQEAIRLNPHDAVIHDRLGSLLAGAGRRDEAGSEFQEAVRLRPDNVSFHDNLGNLLMAKGQTEAAISEFQEAIRLNPNDAILRDNLGNLFARSGRNNEAISQFQEALSFRPDYAKAHDNLGIVLAKQGRMDEAISQFQQASRLSPSFGKAHDNWGYVLASQGRTEEALQQYREALRLNPNDADAQANLAKALTLQSKTPASISAPAKP